MSIFMLYAAALVNFHYNRIFSYQLIPNTVVCIRQKENQGATAIAKDDFSLHADGFSSSFSFLEHDLFPSIIERHVHNPQKKSSSDFLFAFSLRGPPSC
jgi:hypothetical protein